MIEEYINGAIQSLRGQQVEQVGIGGFNLFARVSDSSKYKSKAPIFALEDGSFANDHIINEPLLITISGEVSDIHLRESAITQIQRELTAQVGNISVFLPSRTQTQLSRVNAIANDIQNNYRKIDDAIARGKQAADFFGNKTSGGQNTLRKQFVDLIESIHYGKQLITIDMPYRSHKNMVIIDITIERNNQDEVLRFSVTAQKINFTQLVYTELSSFMKNPASAVKDQASGKKDKGAQAPKKEKSLLSFASGLFGG